MPRKIAAGNWKMNGSGSTLGEIADIARAADTLPAVTTIICTPATLIHRAQTPGLLAIGAQDCHMETSGAHTGDISAEMCLDAGARYIITGHSERRADHGESDAMTAAKTEAVWRAGLTAIVCIGETREQYEAGQTLEVLTRQLTGSLPDNAREHTTIIAYEPVWAIGSGLTPSTGEIANVHKAIRTHMEARSPVARDVPVLYGGSVTADNADAIFALSDVDGALVGGASLTAERFVPIMRALADS